VTTALPPIISDGTRSHYGKLRIPVIGLKPATSNHLRFFVSSSISLLSLRH
jgi:hypothetical protein